MMAHLREQANRINEPSEPAHGCSEEADLYASADVETSEGRGVLVAEKIGRFEHRSVPNPNTTSWARRWKPTAEEFPRLEVIYSVTSEHTSEGWEISRRIAAVNKTMTMNMPNNKPAISRHSLQSEQVAKADTFEQARELVESLLLAASALPADHPPVETDAALASYRHLEQGGDGQPSKEEAKELLEGGEA